MTTIRSARCPAVSGAGRLCRGGALSGRDALTRLQTGADVDYVVTDLTMADGSGGWLMAQLVDALRDLGAPQ